MYVQAYNTKENIINDGRSISHRPITTSRDITKSSDKLYTRLYIYNEIYTQ